MESTAERLSCVALQKGFHVTVRCQLLDTERANWNGCVLKIRLSRSFFVDPYQLTSQIPDANFTLFKPKPRANESSVLGRWLSWFSGSENPADELLPSTLEVPMNQNEVDVEAPAWLADSMSVEFHPKASGKTGDQMDSIAFEVPLHIRYRLPRDDGASIDRIPLAHPAVKCKDGFEYNTWNTAPPFELPVPTPQNSDLLYVLPITVLLLTVGVIVLLLA